MLWQVCFSMMQNKDAPQEEFDSKLADLKKELGYWESYLGSNKYLAGSQFSLAGEGILCVPSINPLLQGNLRLLMRPPVTLLRSKFGASMA